MVKIRGYSIETQVGLHSLIIYKAYLRLCAMHRVIYGGANALMLVNKGHINNLEVLQVLFL